MDTYHVLLNAVLHDILDRDHRAVLAHAVHTIQTLVLDSRVPVQKQQKLARTFTQVRKNDTNYTHQ